MMSTGLKLRNFSGAALLGAALLCAGSASFAAPSQTPKQTPRKIKKVVPPPPPLPSGPTGPVQQVPLDSIGAVAPQVTFQNNQLTIIAPNSTLADILRAVRKQTGAEIDVPPAPERVVTRLGPGPARAVVAELLNGSRFNYVLLGSPSDDAVLTRVVLVAKSGPDTVGPIPGSPAQPNMAQGATPQGQQNPPDMNASDSADDNSLPEENTAPVETPAADAEPPSNSSDQPQVKTPQQMLQEMQQRQMQLQQQQQGQQPVPGSGMPPHPPPQN